MRTRLLAALTTALLLVGSAGGAAHAARVDLPDARGDVWRIDYTGDTSRAPQTRTGDVRRASFVHSRSRVLVRQRFVDLRRVGAYSLHTVRVQTPSKRYREMQVEADRNGWSGTVKVFNRRGDRVRCDAGHNIDYTRNVVVMSIPRSCLGDPRRVRATATSYWAHQRRRAFLTDNPHNERAGAKTWTRWLRAG
jgi:hypothetical protein